MRVDKFPMAKATLGKVAAIGRKLAPGPLYGIHSHEWSALAIEVTWWETQAAKASVI